MKIPFAQLLLELEKQWAKEFSPTDIAGMDQHCSVMQELILASGWSLEDFCRRLVCGDKGN